MSEILKLYTTPGHPTAFSGLERVKKFWRGTYSPQSVASVLEGTKVFTKFRKKPLSKNVNPYFVHRKRRQIQMDLIDVGGLSKFNDGVKFLCVGIDSFTKKASVVPQGSKTGKETLASLRKIFEDIMPPPPETVVFDEGREFKNHLVSSYLSSMGIQNWDAFTSDHKAAIAERFNLTIQTLIYQYLEHNNTKRYIDQLDRLVMSYNSRIHRTTNMTPIRADLDSNQHLVRKFTGIKFGEFANKRHTPKFSLGDRVRLREYKERFTRGYTKNFTSEVFKIVDINAKMPFTMYKVMALDETEPIKGSFYESELQIYRGSI